MADYNVECTIKNLNELIPISIIILSIEIVIPFIFLAILIKYRKKHKKTNLQAINSFTTNFGYFFLDYSEKCFYWEFVILN